MKSESTEHRVKSEADARIESSQATLYDFLSLLARSLGWALPFVTIVGLVAVGSWFAVDKLFTLREDLSKAEIKLLTAQSALVEVEHRAANIKERAKAELLGAQVSQLESSNKTALDTAMAIQAMVATQLESMARSDLIRSREEQLTKQAQSRNEALYKESISKLNTENSALVQRRNGLTETIDLIAYRAAINRLEIDMSKPWIPYHDALMAILREEIQKEKVFNQAKIDAKDSRINWKVRSAIALELYIQKGENGFLDQFVSLIKSNSESVDGLLVNVFSRQGPFKSERLMPLFNAVHQIVQDENIPAQQRENFLDAIVVANSREFARYLQSRSEEDRYRTGRQFVRIFSSRTIEPSNTACQTRFELLSKLWSRDAAEAYSYSVMSNTKPQDDSFKCIIDILKRNSLQPQEAPLPSRVALWLQ